MHSSLVFLILISVILIVIMVTCFFYLIRKRKREDEELMQRVQYNNQFLNQQQQQQQQQLTTPQRQKLPQQTHQSIPSTNEMLIDDQISRYNTNNSNNTRQQNQMIAEYQARNSYTNASPYHSSVASGAIMGSAQGQARQETQSDITQQINAAIIGSSEAEFQNDFIQVFPMYQIAPQPEKNTTPYLT